MFTSTTVFIFLAVLFSGFLQTITGFGYALAAAPLLTLVMNPKDVVMFVLFSGILVKLVLVYRTRHEGTFSSIALIFLASLAGALPGAYIMKFISDSALKLFIGIVLLIATLSMSTNIHIAIRRHRLVKSIVGFISGFLASTTSLNGPPIVFYYLNEKTEKETIRANLCRYFFLGNSSSLLMSYFFGTLHPAVLAMNIAVCIPAILIGFWLGDKLFDRMDAQLFKKLALIVIGASGMINIGSALWPYVQQWTHL